MKYLLTLHFEKQPYNTYRKCTMQLSKYYHKVALTNLKLPKTESNIFA